MTERDEDRELRAAFARLRDDEAARAPALARLLARTNAAARSRAPRRARLRFTLPLAGAAAAGFAWWTLTGAPLPRNAGLASERRPQLLESGRETGPSRSRLREVPPIALGSLRSPTDALLAPPIASLPSGFSRSLIPVPLAPSAQPAGEQQSQSSTVRRFSA